MAQPFDYRLQAQDPFASTLNALKLGSAFQQMQQQQRTSALEQQALQQQIQKQQAFADKISQIKTKGIGNASAEDFLELQMLTDEKQANAIRQGFESLDKNKQQTTLLQVSEVISALENKRPDIAADRLTTQATALRNSGRPEDIRQAELLEAQAELARTNPDFLQFDLSYKIAALPGGKEVLENVKTVKITPLEVKQKTAEAAIKEVEAKFKPDQLLADLNLTKAQIQQANAAAAASRSADAEKRANAQQILAGIIPAEKRPEYEGKMRQEYSNQTKGYQEVKSAYGRVLASQETAAGDLALIFNYMKMLDPGSVVREGEFATAQNAAGVPERVRNLANNLLKGERLNPQQRKMFAKQAEGLFKQAQTQEQTVRKGIERIAQGYGLNTQNIFYEAVESVPTAPSAAPAPAPAGGPRRPAASPAASQVDSLLELYLGRSQ